VNKLNDRLFLIETWNDNGALHLIGQPRETARYLRPVEEGSDYQTCEQKLLADAGLQSYTGWGAGMPLAIGTSTSEFWFFTLFIKVRNRRKQKVASFEIQKSACRILLAHYFLPLRKPM